MTESRIFVGSLVHSEEREKLTIIEKAAIAIKNGLITAVETSGDIKKVPNYSEYEVIRLEYGQFICPGFIDIHAHAPQFPNIGLGYDKPLLEWLKTYTFPLEKRYSDLKFAEKAYRSFIQATLACGTTTACYYATIHTNSAIKLAKEVVRQGQRAIVGKVNMNRCSTEDYVETAEKSLSETERFVEEVKNLNSDLVYPAVTPRFAISCDMQLMKGLAEIAKKYDCFIQTHISENQSEIECVKELFPACTSYTDVYREAGLLTEKTILGHGIYLSDDEQKTLSSAGSSIAHCPISNVLLHSGALNCKKLMQAGVKVGLGTDVSGGSSPSILEALRSSLTTSINISFAQRDQVPLTYHEAFYLATMGGAEALGMENVLGNFKTGKVFDALVIDMTKDIRIGILPEHRLEDIVQKFIYLGDDRNIKQVYVKGYLVKSS